MYFNAKSEGPLKDITFEELDMFSRIVYRRYMCNNAFEDAQGHYPRDPAIHGPQTAAEDVPPLVSIPGEPDEEEGEIVTIKSGCLLPFPKIPSRKRKPTRQCS
jgi:hypothetical protein